MGSSVGLGENWGCVKTFHLTIFGIYLLMKHQHKPQGMFLIYSAKNVFFITITMKFSVSCVWMWNLVSYHPFFQMKYHLTSLEIVPSFILYRLLPSLTPKFCLIFFLVIFMCILVNFNFQKDRKKNSAHQEKKTTLNVALLCSWCYHSL